MHPCMRELKERCGRLRKPNEAPPFISPSKGIERNMDVRNFADQPSSASERFTCLEGSDSTTVLLKSAGGSTGSLNKYLSCS